MSPDGSPVPQPSRATPQAPTPPSDRARETTEGADDTTAPAEIHPDSLSDSDRQSTGRQAQFTNGYHFPPNRPLEQTILQGCISLWHYFLTPMGCFVVIYGLLVVGWGGMVFLILCNAAPAMCHPSCDDIESPRRKWIEIDSQILNALFCVTGFGLAPWRFRDLYYLLQYRIGGKTVYLRRLAGIHRGWFRLPGSERLAPEIGPDNIETAMPSIPTTAVPYPPTTIPDAPLTGVRSPPTRAWCLDFVVWVFISNTLFQVVLSVFMWHFNRYERPTWGVAVFLSLAFLAAGLGGWIIFTEGRRVRATEGVPVTEDDLEILSRDKELGVPHYNNIKDKPKP